MKIARFSTDKINLLLTPYNLSAAISVLPLEFRGFSYEFDSFPAGLLNPDYWTEGNTGSYLKSKHLVTMYKDGKSLYFDIEKVPSFALFRFQTDFVPLVNRGRFVFTFDQISKIKSYFNSCADDFSLSILDNNKKAILRVISNRGELNLSYADTRLDNKLIPDFFKNYMEDITKTSVSLPSNRFISQFIEYLSYSTLSDFGDDNVIIKGTSVEVVLRIVGQNNDNGISSKLLIYYDKSSGLWEMVED
ncbi:MAG: hypothetical protein HY606_07770 [Planctomycetes bacterium]|nr:hypothetical protein [Planctomycetota bacterium]